MRLIKRLGFKQMDREQLDAIFQLMEFTMQISVRNDDRSTIEVAKMKCDRIKSLFEDERVEIITDGSNVVPFKGKDS